MTTEEVEGVYKMQKWSDDEIRQELTRPIESLNMFQRGVEREALSRILYYLQIQKEEQKKLKEKEERLNDEMLSGMENPDE